MSWKYWACFTLAVAAIPSALLTIEMLGLWRVPFPLLIGSLIAGVCACSAGALGMILSRESM